jgi:hypothetical protein
VNALVDRVRLTLHSDYTPYRTEVVRVGVDGAWLRYAAGTGRLELRASLWHFDPELVQWEPMLEPLEVVVVSTASTAVAAQSAAAPASTEAAAAPIVAHTTASSDSAMTPPPPPPNSMFAATQQAESALFLELVRSGRVEEAMTRLQSGAVDVNHRDADGFTALDWLSRRHDVPAIRTLLHDAAASVAVNAGNPDGWRALHWAVVGAGGRDDSDSSEEACLQTARVLVETGGADVRLQCTSSGNTALHLAAMYGLLNVAGYLSAVSSAATHVRNSSGLTALDVAVQCQRADVADVLRPHTLLPVEVRDGSAT